MSEQSRTDRWIEEGRAIELRHIEAKARRLELEVEQREREVKGELRPMASRRRELPAWVWAMAAGVLLGGLAAYPLGHVRGRVVESRWWQKLDELRMNETTPAEGGGRPSDTRSHPIPPAFSPPGSSAGRDGAAGGPFAPGSGSAGVWPVGPFVGVPVRGGDSERAAITDAAGRGGSLGRRLSVLPAAVAGPGWTTRRAGSPTAAARASSADLMGGCG